MKIPKPTRTPRAMRPSFPAIRWIVAAALVSVTSVACDVHSPVGTGDVASMSLTPAQTTLGINTGQQLVLQAFDADGREINSSTAQWSMVNGGGTVDAQGMFRSGMEIGMFSNTVRVSLGGEEAFASFTVVAGPAAQIVVTPNPDTVGIGMTRQFSATAMDEGGNPVSFTPSWSIENGGGTIDVTSGMFTAGQTMGTFSNTVRASSGGLTGFATVTVTPGAAVSLAVTPNSHYMTVNGVQLFTATATDAAGNTTEVTPTWTVVNGGGTIDTSSGMFTAGSTPGSFANTIRASSGGLTATASVTVMAGPVVSITVSPDSASMGTGGAQQFTATAADASGNQVLINPTWSVVSGGGTINASSGLFTAGDSVGVFSGTVRATNNGVSGFATVRVMAGAPVSISVSPNPAELGTGETQQFTATALDAGGNTVSINPVWSVENDGGTINAETGMFTAGTEAGPFTSTVTATSGTLSGTATVNVSAGALDAITVSPNPASVAVDGTQQFTATAVDANGNTVSFTPVWSIENGGGAINSESGVFTAGSDVGTFENTVRATSGTTFGQATVNVTGTTGTSLSLGTAASNGIMAGESVTCISDGTINADVSIHPGSTLSPGECVINGVLNLGNPVAGEMQNDVTTTYNTLAGLAHDTDIVADLGGGTTLLPGVYNSGSSIGVTGMLVLDGNGDADAVFVFQAGSTLTTAGDIILINGAQAKNVWWQVGTSATLGTGSQWQGNIVAQTSITLDTGANLIGRALARTGSVTLDSGNTITLPES